MVGLALLFFSACDKKDSASPFGLNYIFIPQANQSGGVNLNYLVPSGLDTNTYNYKIDVKNNRVNVLLGVNCSGKDAASGYTVNVATLADTVNQLITANKLGGSLTKPAILLPASAYTLPGSVTVPSGQYMTPFYLSIDETQLRSYSGKRVALCVTISNPTHYSLNTIFNKVIIIIDVDALKLT